jgi:preprotein translocase subunit SecD
VEVVEVLFPPGSSLAIRAWLAVVGHHRFEEIPMISFTQSVAMLLACLAGTGHLQQDKSAEKPRVKVEFRLAETAPAEGLIEATEAGSNKKVYLHKTAELTNSDIDGAKLGKNGDGKPVVELSFTKDGGKKMAKMTGENTGKSLAILIDGKVIMAPRINDPISDRAMIDGRFTNEEAAKLIERINAK